LIWREWRISSALCLPNRNKANAGGTHIDKIDTDHAK
jgi:hypothetical protein